MYGAIIGDIAGSTMEFLEKKEYDFPLFAKGSDITDDTIMTVAVARALMQWRREGGDLHEALRAENMECREMRAVRDHSAADNSDSKHVCCPFCGRRSPPPP